MRVIFATVSALALLVAPASAGLRSPQVPVSGSALQSFLNAQGQTIDVASQQLDLFSTNVVTGWTYSVQLAGGSVSGTSFGLYNASLANPPLYLLWPGAAATGWSVTFSIRTLPTRLVENLFDASSALVGTTTYLGVDPSNMGFYCAGPTDVVFSQDARNAGGQPRILVFAGTGAHAGKNWIAVETTPGPGADYADAIYLLAAIAAVDVQHTTWGTLKRRFH